MYNEIMSKMQECRKSLESNIAKFGHAIGAFEDVIDYFINQGIKYTMNYAENKKMLLATVYSKDYNLILDMIKKERPRLIVYSIELINDGCIFNISYNTNWEKEPNYNLPIIESKYE